MTGVLTIAHLVPRVWGGESIRGNFMPVDRHRRKGVIIGGHTQQMTARRWGLEKAMESVGIGRIREQIRIYLLAVRGK